jgi:ABC-type multidrug transport system fused ATPase/permease subunit
MLDVKEGNILIDGINIQNISLGQLRTKLTIIPQVNENNIKR